MQGEKEVEEKIEFVKWFSELNKNSGNIAGGKGANLAEIYNLKIPVPPGFVITAQAYQYFIKKSGVWEKIAQLLEKINYEDTKQLNQATTEIREIIIKSSIPKEMEREILESYEHLDVRELESNYMETPLDVLRTSSEPLFVAVRSSATTEDLADASFAGQQDTYLNIKGNQNLLQSIKKCFASLFTARATYYRNKKGFKHEQSSLAVIIQKMVDSDKSGVIFSKDPSFKKENIILEAVYGLGEGIVSGKITPDRYVLSKDLKIIEQKIADKKLAITRDSSGLQIEVKLTPERSNSQVLKNYEIHKLSEIALKLEDHYKKPQDIEFAIEGEEIYIVQTRPITTMGGRVDSVDEKDIKGEVILTGLGASPGIASGKIKIIENLEELHKVNQGDILVTKMTNPDMVVTMQKAAAIVTDEGGLTAHAAIVSREMGIPAIVGTKEATTKLKDGEIITVNGSTGKIYKGKTAETTQKEIQPVTTQTKTELKVIIDLPSFAERAAKTKLKKVGLTRLEGIIAESGKHPQYYLKNNKIQDYENIIFRGIEKISQYFEELWIRTSDIRTDEFQNLEGAPEIEANPMLGFHGIRYGLKNPEILKAELKALKRVSEKGKKIGLLLPQIISVNEIQKVKEFLKEIDFNDAKIGVMIETPSAVQIINDICKEGIDFISFGTNDLTQYILAVDRGNEEVQYIYDEMHPAVLYQLQYVLRVCARNKIETSICGQAGSKKEMVKYLVENKINSISVNADMAEEIAKYILEIETNLVKGTDKEPRVYQSEEKNKKTEENKEVAEEIKKLEEKVAQETPQESEERIKKDIEAIEEERGKAPKEEEELIQEETIEKTEENKEVAEEVKKLEEKVAQETPQESEERIKKDIEAIEEERKKYSEENKEIPVESKKEEDFLPPPNSDDDEDPTTLDIF